MNDSSKSRFYGAKTIVFWQFEECPIPIPDDIISDEVEANISSAIRDMGYYGPVTMRAYGDIYKLQRECCGFLIFYATSETTQDKILVDLLGQAVFWPRDSPINLMLIVGDISRHAGLLNAIDTLVAHGNFNIILSQPQNVASGQPPYGVDKWLWEDLAVNGKVKLCEDLAGEDLAGEYLVREDLAREDLAGEDLAVDGKVIPWI
ncbi:unnamed protein product [Arabidopsis halleri]